MTAWQEGLSVVLDTLQCMNPFLKVTCSEHTLTA